MRLVTNSRKSQNHLSRLYDLASKAEEIVVMSPYLARDLAGLVSSLPIGRLQRFRLITTVHQDGRMQLDWARALKSLQHYFTDTRPDVFWSVATADDLHGKVYAFLAASRAYAVIITSANFTNKGLRTNQEWGVENRDRGFVNAVMRSIAATPTQELTAEQIDRLYQSAEAMLSASPAHLEPSLDLPALLPDPRIYRGRGNVWLKPSGVAENPVLPKDTRYAKRSVNLRFTTRRPSGVQIGDRMVVYGVGDGRLLGLFEVTGEPEHATPKEIDDDSSKERWPWSVTANNLTYGYSGRWWKFDLRLRGLEHEYHRSHPSAPLTAAGGETLGALNYGSDKIRLPPQFAAFLIDKLWSAEMALPQLRT